MIRLPGRKNRKRTILLGIAGALVACVIVFVVVYFVLFPTSSPKPFKLSAASPGTATSAGGAGSSSAASSSSGGSLAGRWTVAAGSQGGYRVREKLAFLPAQSDAVGRTSQITGSATFAGSGSSATIAAASFSVAVNTLKSDASMRDAAIRTRGIESESYPTATFALASPITVPASLLSGQVTHLSVRGTVSMHGVTKQETIPVEMRLSGSTLQAAGSITFPWSEFGMSAPSIGGFVSVMGKATMEFDLRLRRA